MATTMPASTVLPPVSEKIAFAEPLRPRRFSNATTGTDDEFEDNVYEDWSKTTHEKDSWANRELRRSNKFSTIDNDVALQKLERTRSGRRGSSALGIFSQGIDKNGNATIMSDDHHDDWDDVPAVPVSTVVEVDQDGRKSLASTSISSVFLQQPADERRLSMSSSSQASESRRRGSILSLWTTGKDSNGHDHVHAGHEGEDWAAAADEVVSIQSGSAPGSPSLEAARADRRGSILSIWRQGKDRDGHTVIHSGEEHDEVLPTLDADGRPIATAVVVVEDKKDTTAAGAEKIGSVLSIWSHGRDKDGRTVIHSGEEHDGAIAPPVIDDDTPRLRGQERRGSILSMWTEDKRDAQDRPAVVTLRAHDEDDV